MRAAVHAAVALLCCLGAAHGALFNQTTFLGTGRSPPWWSVVRSDVPALAAKANELQAVLSDSPTFGQVVSGMLGDDAGDATVARTLAYMLNQNLTYGGGCPVPPHSAAFNTLLGEGMASSLLAANSTNEAAEALLGAFFAAGRTCGPPNALSSRSATQARTKYKNATCCFIGPVIAAPMRNPTFSYMLNAVAGARLASDAWASGALLGGIVDCVAGGHAAQTPPDWLYQGFGPLSIAPAYAPAGAAVAPVGGAPAAETASAGR